MQARLAAIPVVPALVEGKWLKASGGAMTWADVPSFTLPTRLGTVAATITDWNTAIDNGWYMAAGAANAPDGSNWFIGEVVQHNPSWVTQNVRRFTDGTYAYRYRRALNNTVWSAWVLTPSLTGARTRRGWPTALVMSSPTRGATGWR